MNEAYAFTIILIAAAVIAVVAFIVGVIIKYKQDKENATKKKVYVSTLVLTYCGVGTALMNKRELTYKNNTYEEAMKRKHTKNLIQYQIQIYSILQMYLSSTKTNSSQLK